MVPSHKLSKKELLFAALRHEEIPAILRVPFAGVHAGALKGYSAREVLTKIPSNRELVEEIRKRI